MENKTTTIRPLGHYVLIENPLRAGLVDSIKEKVDKLPPKDRDAYVKNFHQEIFENIKIVEVGPDVTTLTPGDIGVSSPQLLASAHPVEKEAYLLISAHQIIAKNVGTSIDL